MIKMAQQEKLMIQLFQTMEIAKKFYLLLLRHFMLLRINTRMFGYMQQEVLKRELVSIGWELQGF